MADYVAEPQVLDESTILLYGNYYHIKGTVESVLGTQFPQKLVIGDYGKDDNPTISTHSVSNLSGGMGLWKYRGDPGEETKYWTADGITTWQPPGFTLGPLKSSISRPAGVAATGTPPRSCQSFGGLVVVIWGAEIYTHNYTAWSALVDTLPDDTNADNVVFNDRLFYALRAAGYSYQAAPGAVATDVATPLFESFTVHDGKIWGIDTSGVLYWSTTGNAASWTTVATLSPVLSTTASNYKELVTYDDASGYPAIWGLTGIGPYIYDNSGDVWTKLKVQVPYFTRLTDIRAWGTVWRDSLYELISDRTVWKLTMNGQTLVVEDISPGFPDGLPTALTGAIHRFAPSADGMYIGMGRSWLDNTIGMIIMYLKNGGWHNIYIGASQANMVPNVLSAINNNALSVTGRNRLFFMNYTAADGDTVDYIDLDMMQEPFLLSTTRTYAASGNVELPYFDGKYEAQQKVAVALRVKLTGASANETCQIAYRIDGSTGAYTNLGSAITANTEQTLRFGTNNVGLAFKSIQFKVSLVRGGTTTNAPKVEYIALDYMRLPEVRQGFRVTIDCTNGFNNISPQQQMENLWTAIGTSTFGTFAFRNDTGGTRSYLVKAMRPEQREGTGADTTGFITLYLQEITDNTGA